MIVNVGEKYYYYTSDENNNDILNIVRITKVRKNEVYGILNDLTKVSIKPSELKTYTLLKPDAYLVMSIVELGDKNEDVIITISRTKDGGITSEPFAICRQAVADVFANQIIREDLTFLIGTSVNKNNCPTNVDFKMLLACDKLKYWKMFACYMDDKLEDVLALNTSDKFDETLKALYNKAPKIIKQMDITLPVHGFCKSLKELLDYNNFELDYLATFDIHKINEILEYNIESLQLSDRQKPMIEEIVGKYMFNTYVVKYDKTINANLIKRNHIFISDKNGDVYIIAYDSGDNLDISQKAIYQQIHKAMHDFKKSLDPVFGASK